MCKQTKYLMSYIMSRQISKSFSVLKLNCENNLTRQFNSRFFSAFYSFKLSTGFLLGAIHISISIRMCGYSGSGT